MILLFIFATLVLQGFCSVRLALQKPQLLKKNYLLLEMGQIEYPQKEIKMCSSALVDKESFFMPALNLTEYSSISSIKKEMLHNIYQEEVELVMYNINSQINTTCLINKYSGLVRQKKAIPLIIIGFGILAVFAFNAISSVVAHSRLNSIQEQFQQYNQRLTSDLHNVSKRISELEDVTAFLLQQVQFRRKLQTLEQDRIQLLKSLITPELSHQLSYNFMKNQVSASIPEGFDYLVLLRFSGVNCSPEKEIRGNICLVYGKNKQTSVVHKLIPFSYFSPDFTSLTTPEIDHDVLFMSDGASVDIKQCANIISAYSCPITAFSNISCSPNNVEHCRSKTIDISAPFTRIHRLGNDLIEIATTEEAYIYCNGKCQTVTMPSSGIMVTRLHKGEYIEVGSQIYRGMGSSETIFHFPTVTGDVYRTTETEKEESWYDFFNNLG